MRRTRITALVLFPLALAACEAPEAEMEATEEEAPATMTPATEADIAQVRDEWVRMAEANDPAGLAALYAEDAVMVAPTGELVEGRQAIQQAHTPMLEAMASVDISSTGTVLGSHVSTDMGTFSQMVQTPDGEQTMEGHYIVVLERQDDGSWQIVQQLSAFPAPSPAGPGSGADDSM